MARLNAIIIVLFALSNSSRVCFTSNESQLKGEFNRWCFITRLKACFTVHIDRTYKHSSVCPRLCKIHTLICIRHQHHTIFFWCVVILNETTIPFSVAAERSRLNLFNLELIRLWVVCSTHLSQFVWCSSSIWTCFQCLCARSLRVTWVLLNGIDYSNRNQFKC